MLACKPKGCQFDSQSRAHAWVAGEVPSRVHVRGNHTLMFSLSLPSPLSKNKYIKIFKKFKKDLSLLFHDWTNSSSAWPQGPRGSEHSGVINHEMGVNEACLLKGEPAT